jgi:hypothetical protein
MFQFEYMSAKSPLEKEFNPATERRIANEWKG